MIERDVKYVAIGGKWFLCVVIGGYLCYINLEYLEWFYSRFDWWKKTLFKISFVEIDIMVVK